MNTDLISRQAVIDSLYDWSNHSMTYAETWHLRQIIGDIKSMPSVNPKPCEDAISREAVISIIEESQEDDADEWMDYPWKVTPNLLMDEMRKLPSVTPKQRMGRCKDCKYFEYDSWANVDGVPLIVAHEICSRWGDGCKTSEDGYCFLFELQENCDTCKHKDDEWDSEHCDGCCGNHSGFEPQESEEISREEIAALLARESEEQT